MHERRGRHHINSDDSREEASVAHDPKGFVASNGRIMAIPADSMSQLRQPIHEDDHYQGALDAPCTLVEYGDYESSRCLYARHVVKELQRQFGRDLLFVFRHFPISGAQSYAELAAEASEYAATRGMFWQMHDLLYQSQERDGNPAFQELAEILALDPVALLRDLENGTFEKRVHTDVLGGRRSGVTDAPAFFIKHQRYKGPVEFEGMSAHIRSILGSSNGGMD